MNEHYFYKYRPYIALLCLLLLICGCSSKKVYYKTESDPYFIFISDEPLKQKRVKIILDDEASIEEKRFAYQLEDIMQKRGFDVRLEDESALCVLGFTLHTPSYTHKGNYTLYHTHTTTTLQPSGYSANGFSPMQSVTNTYTTPQNYVYSYTNTYKKIYMQYVCLDKANKASRFWDGFFSAELSTYHAYQSRIISFIVDTIGQDKEGYYYPYDELYMEQREQRNTRTRY